MFCSTSTFQLSLWILFIINFLVPIYAQTVQEIIWNSPNGNLSDFSQTFNEGDTLQLSWNPWKSTEFVDTTKNLVDLWCDGFNFNFPQRLAAGINLTFPGGYLWTISIPADNLTYSAKYVLRFKITSLVFNASDGDLSSPGFLVLQAASSLSTISSSSTASSSSTQASTTVSNTAQTCCPTDTSTATATQFVAAGPSVVPSSSLSGGAKGGIACGAILAAALAMGAAWYISRVRKRKKEQEMARGNNVFDDSKSPPYTGPAELPSGLNMTELPG